MAGTRPLTDQEVQEVIDALDGKYAARDRALFVLGLRTGFRVAELLSLRVGDVWAGDRVVDRITVRRGRMKARRKGRTVVLHPEAKRRLAEWIAELLEDGVNKASYIFRSRKGEDRPITSRQAQRILAQAFVRCGLDGPLGTHSMRKTFAKRVHEALGRDLFKTQRALGHSNIQSTVHYMTWDQDELDEAILAA